MREKALNLLGLMRKANALRIGEEETGAAVREHEAKLVLLASDASPNARKRASGYMYGSKAPLITVPFTKEEISEHGRQAGLLNGLLCAISALPTHLCRDCAIYLPRNTMKRHRSYKGERRKAKSAKTTFGRKTRGQVKGGLMHEHD